MLETMLCLSRATSAPAAADGNRRVKWPEPITTKRKKKSQQETDNCLSFRPGNDF